MVPIPLSCRARWLTIATIEQMGMGLRLQIVLRPHKLILTCWKIAWLLASRPLLMLVWTLPFLLILMMGLASVSCLHMSGIKLICHVFAWFQSVQWMRGCISVACHICMLPDSSYLPCLNLAHHNHTDFKENYKPTVALSSTESVFMIARKMETNISHIGWAFAQLPMLLARRTLSLVVYDILHASLAFMLVGGWRNGLVFDPLQKYGKWSYADFFLYPLADALAQSVSANTRVRFGMQVRFLRGFLCSSEISAYHLHAQKTWIALLTKYYTWRNECSRNIYSTLHNILQMQKYWQVALKPSHIQSLLQVMIVGF